MNCCQCQGIELEFNRKEASEDLQRYREKGPDETTRMLIDALKAEGVEGMTLLDIGGGIGAIQYELLRAGAKSAFGVDASSAYVQAASEEAARQGLAQRVSHQHGDFVDLASQIPPADIVTLDRVICCYHDMAKLVGLSAARARVLFGLVYPRDTWWFKLGLPMINFTPWLRRSPFRAYLHPSRAVDAVLRGVGLQPRFYARTWVWQVVVYAR